MATLKKKHNIYFLLGFLMIIIAAMIVIPYLYSLSDKVKSEPAQLMINEYQNLQKSYESTINEIEQVSDSEFDKLGIIKSNLRAILDEIRTKQRNIERLRKKGSEKISFDSLQIRNYRDRLEMSKMVSDALLQEKQAASPMVDTTSITENVDTTRIERTDNIKENLERLKNYYEIQKAKNENIFATVNYIKQKREYLLEAGDIPLEEISELDRKILEYSRELEMSKKQIESQNNHINKYIKSLRKVNLNCYFIYTDEEGNEEGIVFLTSNGASRLFLDYFVENRPQIHFKFEIHDELLQDTTNKFDVIVYNSENEVMYSTTTEVNESGTLHLKLPGGFFNPGKYKVRLSKEDENILIGEEYVFRI